MTGVRSFDIKAYDNALAGYADLGWGDDLRLYQPYSGHARVAIPATAATGLGTLTPSITVWPPLGRHGESPGQSSTR